MFLYEKTIGDADDWDVLLVTADRSDEHPIEVGTVDGVMTLMSVKDARRVRKALKKAIKAAERYQRSR